MPHKTAGIIIVGDEILKGMVQDTNSYYICKRLRSLGTKVGKISVISDDIEEVASTVKEFSDKFDIVLTSGGIGPTHDDITFKGIAKGFEEEVVLNKELEQFWKAACTVESSEAMSFVPKSAKLIWVHSDSTFLKDLKNRNVKKFPLVSVRNVFVFPGVPQYLENLFAHLEKEHFESHGCFFTGRIYLRVHEEVVLQALNDTVGVMTDCVFGSYPVLGNDEYQTQITVEAGTVCKVRAAEQLLKSLVPREWLARQAEMEDDVVYKFRQTVADSRLAATLDATIKVVEEVYDKYPAEALMLSFNGGKDCTVLLHIVLAVKQRKGVLAPLQAVYFRPTNPFPQVEEFVHATVEKLGIDLTTLPGPIKPALEVLQRDKPAVKAIFLGTRRTDPHSQNLNVFQMTDPGWAQVMRINPILDWRYSDVWTFLRGIEAPYCSLYDLGYTSLGNTDNTQPNPSLVCTRDDGSQGYQPAWMLTDDAVERDGRS